LILSAGNVRLRSIRAYVDRYSVAATVAMADDDDGTYDMTEMILAVAVSAFLSGFFTSYFAGD
jgi:hypothetical protein